MKTLVSNNFELAQLLIKEFYPRINIDQQLLLDGVIQGTLDGKLFKIEFVADEYMNISTYSDNRELLDEFLPLLKRVMANTEPLCFYDVKSPFIVEDEFVSVLEWELLYPQETLYDIASGKVFNYRAKILNFNVFNSNKILLKTNYIVNNDLKK